MGGMTMGEKTMSGDDGFLARWSRRKRVSAARKRDPAKPQPPSVATDAITASVGRDASEAIAEPPSLPPIESLDAASDFTPFLAPGVPTELTRRALRQAWKSDPAIRDFVGLSENSWDFNAPGGVPGFGPLSQEDIRGLLEQVMGKPETVDPPANASGPAAAPPPAAPTGNATPTAEIATETPVVATQPEPDQQRPRASPPSRRHGSALPRG